MPERLDLRYANLAAAVADEPGGDRLDDLGVGQSVDDGDHRAEVDDARGVRSGWHRRAQSGALVAELAQFKLAPEEAVERGGGGECAIKKPSITPACVAPL